MPPAVEALTSPSLVQELDSGKRVLIWVAVAVPETCENAPPVTADESQASRCPAAPVMVILVPSISEVWVMVSAHAMPPVTTTAIAVPTKNFRSENLIYKILAITGPKSELVFFALLQFIVNNELTIISSDRIFFTRPYFVRPTRE
jgi:hypothetical protein